MTDIKIKKLRPEAVIPTYKKAGDAGFDFYIVEEITIQPGEAAILPTGLAVALPEGCELQIRLRSSAALNTPLILPNAPATVDSGYRGELGIIVRNLSGEPFTVKKGERIAQGVLAKVEQANFILTDTLPPSERGQNGYGSTGNN